MSKVIEINNLSKVYDLGLVGTGTLSKDLNRTWAKLIGKPDPYAKLVELNDRTKKSSSNMVYALKDINFSVEQGEVLGIIGKNGAGKSTLLKILSEITSPSKGSIKMKGRVASLLEVGTGMHPEMTARQNIYLNGSLMGMSRKEITSKLDEIVNFAGIDKYIDTAVKRFSSGMKVRLGFAVAAFLEPEILIVDEVLAVGDAEFQKKAIGKMKSISEGFGRTVLFVSHNMNSVTTLCSKCVHIDNGMIVNNGNTNSVVNSYLQDSNSNKNSQTFTPPIGNENVKLISAKILKEKNKVLLIQDDIIIEIEYRIDKKINSKIIPNVHLHSLKGEYILCSSCPDKYCDTDINTYRRYVTIPKNLLNTGIYTIGVACSSLDPQTIVHLYAKDALSFEIVENIDLRKTSYKGKLPGLIRPQLNWKK